VNTGMKDMQQLIKENHDQIVTSIQNPGADPDDTPVGEMTDEESGHNPYSLTYCLLLYTTSNNVRHYLWG
jgi:hypothetical protein